MKTLSIREDWLGAHALSSHLMRKIVINETGVYQPTSLRTLVTPPLFALVAVALLLSIGKLSLTPALFLGFGVVTAGCLLPSLWERRKYGLLGKPFVSVHDDQLNIALLQDSRGSMEIPIVSIREIVVYVPAAFAFVLFATTLRLLKPLQCSKNRFIRLFSNLFGNVCRHSR